MSDIIRFATIDDVDDIMEFIHNHWKKNHILSQNKNFFLYEHQDNNRINFVVYRDSKNKLGGILGFIKSSSNNSDIWTVLWKALSNKEHPMLGIELFDFLRKSQDYNILLSPGINGKTIGIYKYLGIYTGYLRQFVLINDKIKKFKIAKILDKKYLQQVQFIENNEYNLKQLSEREVLFDFEKYKETIPYKDKRYFIKRYFNHPIYKYDVYGIFKNSEIHSLLVTRVVSKNGSNVLRIVDFIGDQEVLKFVTQNLYEKITDEKYEYMDFMCFGFDNELLLKAGFHQINSDSSDLIIPNHFSPFVSENIKINFFADTSQIEKVRMCKADGDQDRPV
jgi:hypothetical protein